MAEGGASSTMLSQVYSTFQQRASQGQLSAAGWTGCTSPTSTAAGCTQSAGWGTNCALQANFTCGSDVLSVYVLVNTFSSFVNVDDMTVAGVTAGGTTTPDASASSPVNNIDVGLELDPANLTCASLPINWGDDDDTDDDSQNGPWQDLTTAPSQAVLDTVYSTLQQRLQEGQIPAIADWATCDTTPTSSAVGCEQTAGQGTNYALEVNYTCAGTGTTLGLIVKVNTFQDNVNVDNVDPEFIAVNGTVVQDLDYMPMGGNSTTGGTTTGGGTSTPSAAFSCSSLPSNWGQDQDNNNGAWSAMSADSFSSAMASEFGQRIGDIGQHHLIPSWATCAAPETSAVGCTQSAGGGTNYAVQANITCNGVTLGMAGLINTYQSYTNLDDAAILFVATDGAITTVSFNPDTWYMPESDVFGRQVYWQGNDDNDDD
ncbi:hypothetical protein ABPG75_009483 [Micractinium tetrahymenae]